LGESFPQTLFLAQYFDFYSRVSIQSFKKLLRMKKIALVICGVTFLALTTTAQQPYLPSNNPTVTAITSKYSYKEVKHEEVTDDKVFPILGNYMPETNSEVTGTVHISIDPDNKGIVWIDGLPQGKVKAMLRIAPSTYKIPAQKTEQGTDVTEGVLIYDKALNKLSICIGRTYNEKNPSEAFTTTEDDMTATSEAATVTEPQKTNATTKGSKTKMKVKKEEVKVVKPWILYASKIEPQTETK
jgi:hypothetical protein